MNILKAMKNLKPQQTRYKEEPNRNFRTEKYNYQNKKN